MTTLYLLYYGWYFGLPALGVLSGLAGRRVRWVRIVLVAAAPVYAVGLYTYFWFRGGPDECTSPGGINPPITCHPTSLMSGVGTFGLVVYTVTMVLSLAPIPSAWMRRRAPSVASAIVLVLLTILFLYGLLIFLPSTVLTVGAAIAGPPDAAPLPQPEPVRDG